LVAEAQPGGPAASAGIVSGDVIVSVDNNPISKGADLAARIGAMSPGASATIGVIRDGRERTIAVRLGELPATPFKTPTEPAPEEPSHLGLTLAPANSVQGAGSQGVVVLKVDPNGLAAEKGLSAGDVILTVANRPVNSSADVHNAIAQAEKTGKRDVLMRIKTEDDRIEFVALPLPAQVPSVWSRIQSWIRSL
jgi:serine protease Do